MAAHELDRRWIGIDINKEAWNTILDRANKPSFYQWLNSFSEAQLISRDPDSINSISPNDFQNWVNGWYKATRPKPDRGIDGITPDGIGIQSKTYEINYEIIDRLVQAARHHPATTKPIKKAIAVSQTGFSDSARDRQDSYKDEGIKIILAAPKKMLDPEKFEEIL